jgi:hypothetical protein
MYWEFAIALEKHDTIGQSHTVNGWGDSDVCE